MDLIKTNEQIEDDEKMSFFSIAGVCILYKIQVFFLVSSSQTFSV